MAVMSERKKFIFVHIRKTAGSSVRSILHRNIPEKYVIKLANRALRRFGLQDFKSINPLENHATAEDYRQLLGERYKDFFKFAFTRNPYEWHVSYFHYLRESFSEPDHHLVKRMSFGDYIRWRCADGFELQSDWVTDKNGRIIVNFLGKVETMSNDFSYLKQKLALKGSLPHKNASSHRHYSFYYDKSTAYLVKKFYEKDFVLFSYDFTLV